MTDGPIVHAYDGERTEAFSPSGFLVMRFALCRNVRDGRGGVSTMPVHVNCPDCLEKMR